MRGNLRYKKYYAYKKNRKRTNIKRQLYMAGLVFAISIVLTIVTISIALTGNDKGVKGSSVPDESAKEQVENKQEISINNETKIRVVIKTNDFNDIFHGDVELSSDVGILITPKNSVNAQQVLVEGNQSVKVSAYENLFTENSVVHVKTQKENGAIYLNSVERSCGRPAYYGEFDIYKTDKGYVIVNELPFDKYICGVVPSEMPESYGMEALKAQAICARSYAARRINSLGYPEYEAAVDDSVRYQVYNNFEVTQAVKEAVDSTAGELALYNGEIIDAYFYATSCGTTAGGEVWSEAGGQCPYLKSRELNEENKQPDLSSETAFCEFIENEDAGNFDGASPWYRWEITLDFSRFSEEFMGEYGNISQINVKNRTSGGVITKLELVGEKKTYILEKEYDIREFLGKVFAEGTNKANKISDKTTMLPSASFYIKEIKDNKAVIKGGGYGHGVGMSQTGAKGMCEKGYDYKRILCSFYPGITVEKKL